MGGAMAVTGAMNPFFRVKRPSDATIHFMQCLSDWPSDSRLY
jgi:hypothetical protein